MELDLYIHSRNLKLNCFTSIIRFIESEKMSFSDNPYIYEFDCVWNIVQSHLTSRTVASPHVPPRLPTSYFRGIIDSHGFLQ